MKIKIPIEIKTVLGLLLLVSGVIFYVGWSAYYGAWTDIGVYSLSIILIVSGVLGILLSIIPEQSD
jgi:hypothetical protein